MKIHHFCLQSFFLLQILRGFRQMIAVIGDSDNVGSIGLHASLGFRQIGVMKAVGLKFGQWVDVVYMQRPLGEAERTLP